MDTLKEWGTMVLGTLAVLGFCALLLYPIADEVEKRLNCDHPNKRARPSDMICHLTDTEGQPYIYEVVGDRSCITRKDNKTCSDDGVPLVEWVNVTSRSRDVVGQTN